MATTRSSEQTASRAPRYKSFDEAEVEIRTKAERHTRRRGVDLLDGSQNLMRGFIEKGLSVTSLTDTIRKVAGCEKVSYRRVRRKLALFGLDKLIQKQYEEGIRVREGRAAWGATASKSRIKRPSESAKSEAIKEAGMSDKIDTSVADALARREAGSVGASARSQAPSQPASQGVVPKAPAGTPAASVASSNRPVGTGVATPPVPVVRPRAMIDTIDRLPPGTVPSGATVQSSVSKPSGVVSRFRLIKRSTEMDQDFSKRRRNLEALDLHLQEHPHLGRLGSIGSYVAPSPNWGSLRPDDLYGSVDTRRPIELRMEEFEKSIPPHFIDVEDVSREDRLAAWECLYAHSVKFFEYSNAGRADEYHWPYKGFPPRTVVPTKKLGAFANDVIDSVESGHLLDQMKKLSS